MKQRASGSAGVHPPQWDCHGGRVSPAFGWISIHLGFCLATGLFLAGLTGCESTDDYSTSGSGGMYYGAGFYDPWYYGGDYDDVDIIVTPPDPPTRPPSTPPPRPTHPIAPPSVPRPTPMPSIPSMPRAVGRR